MVEVLEERSIIIVDVRQMKYGTPAILAGVKDLTKQIESVESAPPGGLKSAAA